MPVYEYTCPKCNTKFELIRPFSKADEEAACPKCKAKVKRDFSRFSVLDTYKTFVPGLGNTRSAYKERTGKPGIWKPGTRKATKRRTRK